MRRTYRTLNDYKMQHNAEVGLFTRPSILACKKWQARRDSNPQHPDLESGALTVRATGLHKLCLLCLQGSLRLSHQRHSCENNKPKSINKPNKHRLLRFLMNCMGPAKWTIFFKCQFIWCFSFIFCGRIIPVLTSFTGQCNYITHCCKVSFYSIISLMTPAPTVLPPSRMANLNSFSIAMGVIKSTAIDTLSPGITISIPSGNVVTPVTSVVRK